MALGCLGRRERLGRDGGEKTANYNILLLLETKLKETNFMYITDGKNYLNASRTEYFLITEKKAY